jgi:hypothetical protein
MLFDVAGIPTTPKKDHLNLTVSRFMGALVSILYF